MNIETREKIEVFLREQMANTSAVAEQYTTDPSGNQYPKRDIFTQVKAYADDFLGGNMTYSWCIVTGLRGVGKTTMLMQILSEMTRKEVDTLFLSVDRITELFNVSLFDVLRVYEEISGSAFENREKPLILFIDEAQYDKKWGITLKDVYDRAKRKVFIYVTGSSALHLSENNDIVRREESVKMLPLSFTEYMTLKNKKPLHAGIQKQIRTAFFESVDADEVYHKITSLESEIKKYYASIDPSEVKKYIKMGSLPSMLLKQPEEAFNSCNRILDRIIGEDITQTSNFKIGTIKKAPTVLYLLASADQISYESLGKNALNLSRHTTKNLFDAFVGAGMLQHIPAYTASHNAQVRQRSKFLFIAPVFRSAIFKKGGSTLSPEVMYGKLLEDIVGLTLHRVNVSPETPDVTLTYDAKEGGADFVVNFGGKNIVIEVSAGGKNLRQVKQTAKRANPAFSVVVDNTSTVSLDSENNTIKIPLEYFLLM